MIDQIIERLDKIEQNQQYIINLLVDKNGTLRVGKKRIDDFIDQFLENEDIHNYKDVEMKKTYDSYLEGRQLFGVTDGIPCSVKMFYKKVQQRFPELTRGQTTVSKKTIYFWK